MQNVIIDSCVFFGMIKYNNFALEYGAENLPELFARNELELAQLKERIEAYFDDDFNKKYKNLTFEEKIKVYKNYQTNNIGNLTREIESTQNLLNGFTYNKDGTKKHLKISSERKQQLQLKLQELKQRLAFFETDRELDFNLYKLKKNSLQNGYLYKMALDGEIKLHVISVSYDEILNHTIPRPNVKNWKCFTPEEVSALTQHCTLITTHSAQVLQDMQELATLYRTKTAVAQRKAMAQDINSKGVYGDSLIMAGANMSGMILLTQNVKDFIEDLDKIMGNDYIRRHISAVSADMQYGTDALPYSVDEFLHGNYTIPTVNSEMYSLASSTQSSEFALVYEMV